MNNRSLEERECATNGSLEDITQGIPSPLVLDDKFFCESTTDDVVSETTEGAQQLTEQNTVSEQVSTATCSLLLSTETPEEDFQADERIEKHDESQVNCASEAQPADIVLRGQQAEVVRASDADERPRDLRDLETAKTTVYSAHLDELKRLREAMEKEETERLLVDQKSLSRTQLRQYIFEATSSFGDVECECVYSKRRHLYNAERDLLGDLLSKFLNAIVLVRDSHSRVEQHVATCAARAEAVWTFDRRTVELEGVCVDSARVTRRVEFDTAQLDESVLRSLSESLAATRNELFDTFVNAAAEAIAARAAIDTYLDDLYSACPTLRSLPDSVDVQGQSCLPYCPRVLIFVEFAKLL